MPNQTERDYVLGTHDDEIRRLGRQHELWRQTARAGWIRAGIGIGSRVLDVGAGPGFATTDLAELVGPTGAVIGVERSSRYVEAARARCESGGFGNVSLHGVDLMVDPLPAADMDAAWCRWVACFVNSPETLIAKVSGALKPGGRLIFHEYIDYETWRLVPESPALGQFVAHVMASWRDNGSEPNVARVLGSLLAKAGFKIRSSLPMIHCALPDDPWWQWPAEFLKVGPKRLLELGRVDAAWVANLECEIATAEANPNSIMVTPMFVEIIAEKS